MLGLPAIPALPLADSFTSKQRTALFFLPEDIQGSCCKVAFVNSTFVLMLLVIVVPMLNKILSHVTIHPGLVHFCRATKSDSVGNVAGIFSESLMPHLAFDGFPALCDLVG